MWRVERLRHFLRFARGGQLRDAPPPTAGGEQPSGLKHSSSSSLPAAADKEERQEFVASLPFQIQDEIYLSAHGSLHLLQTLSIDAALVNGTTKVLLERDKAGTTAIAKLDLIQFYLAPSNDTEQLSAEVPQSDGETSLHSCNNPLLSGTFQCVRTSEPYAHCSRKTPLSSSELKLSSVIKADTHSSSKTHSDTAKDSKRHLFTLKNSKRYSLTEKDSKRHSLRIKDSKRHSLSEKDSKRHSLTEKDSKRHSLTEKDSKKHARTEKSDSDDVVLFGASNITHHNSENSKDSDTQHRCPLDNDPTLEFVLKSGALNDQILGIHFNRVKAFSRAVHYFECASVRGLRKGTYNLGVCYALGKGVAKDETKACDLFEEASKEGHPKAMYALAFHLLNGQGGRSKETKRGMRMMMAAAEAGNMRALLYAGVDLIFEAKAYDRFVDDCQAKGLEFLKEAGKRSDADALYLLGEVYGQGLAGVRTNVTESEAYFEKALQLGLKD